MSLRVWMPLTKDLRQQGLDSTTVTQNSGTTISGGGKLGSCLTATSNATVVVNLPSLATMLANGKSYSLACWVKITGNVTTDSWIIKLGTNNCGLWWAASEARWVWNENDGGKRCANPTISADTTNWHHLVTTVTKSSNGSTTTARHYVDGMPATSYKIQTWDNSGKAQPTGTTITISPYAASLNDIRLYDHCLSESEVKRLAQGLIVHYPLNRQGLGQENLLRGTYDWSQWIASSRASFSNEVATLAGSTADWGAAIHSARLNKALLDGTTTYTWSFEYKSTATWACHSVIGGTTAGIDDTSAPRTKYVYWQGIISLSSTNGNWKKYVLTPRTITESQMTNGSGDVNSWFLQLYNRTDNASVQIRHIKLEKGSIATPWCPNIIDIDNIGLDSTTEYDISGFGYNGTRINFPQQNLLLGTDFSTQYTTGLVTNNSTDWTKYLRGYNTSSLHTFSNGEDTITLNTASNLGVCFVRKATGINLDPNSYYTLSCEAKSTQTAKPLCIGLSYYNNSNTWIWRGGTNPTNFTTANAWQKFSLTFKPDADTQYICYCFTVVGVANSTDTFTIRHCKLEKGSVATPWVEDSYSSWTSDTPKYQVSTVFTAEPNAISSVTNFSHLTTFTYSCWIKTNTAHNAFVLMGYQYGNNTSGSLALDAGVSKAGFHYYAHTGGQGDVTIGSNVNYYDNQWHMLTATYDGSKIITYFDGVKTAEGSVSLLTSSRTFSLNQPSGASGRYFKGQMSDARVYATALSATDVKSLYQNCATIGSDGTIYGQIRS